MGNQFFFLFWKNYGNSILFLSSPFHSKKKLHLSLLLTGFTSFSSLIYIYIYIHTHTHTLLYFRRCLSYIYNELSIKKTCYKKFWWALSAYHAQYRSHTQRAFSYLLTDCPSNISSHRQDKLNPRSCTWVDSLPTKTTFIFNYPQ